MKRVYIKRILDPVNGNISAAAELYGVTRQTIYNWLAGKAMQPMHKRRVESVLGHKLIHPVTDWDIEKGSRTRNLGN